MYVRKTCGRLAFFNGFYVELYGIERRRHRGRNGSSNGIPLLRQGFGRLVCCHFLIACATNASHSWLVADVGEMFSDPDAAEVTLGEIRRLLDRHRDAVARELLDVDPENGDGPDAP